MKITFLHFDTVFIMENLGFRPKSYGKIGLICLIMKSSLIHVMGGRRFWRPSRSAPIRVGVNSFCQFNSNSNSTTLNSKSNSFFSQIFNSNCFLSIPIHFQNVIVGRSFRITSRDTQSRGTTLDVRVRTVRKLRMENIKRCVVELH